MSKEEGRLYEFGPFTLDASEHVLLRGGEPVPLTPKVFETLVLLVERHGRLVEKSELMKALWPDSFVEESNLTNNISVLRRALGEPPDRGRYIETVPKRGYRFAAEVRMSTVAADEVVIRRETITRVVAEEEEERPEASAPTAGVATPTQTVARPTARWMRAQRVRSVATLVALLCLSAVAALAALYRPWAAPSASGAANAPAPRSVAVLPFKAVGDGAADEYLGSGLSDALIVKLGGARGTIVRPMSAVRRYDDPAQDPLAAGREQGVEAVLEGSVQRAGDRVRVSVQLLRVADGVTLWSGQFNEKFTDILILQDSISGRVMRELLMELKPAERERLARRGTTNADAYHAYLKGRYFWNKRTQEGFVKAVESFEHAISIDPNYAQAHAGLADAYHFVDAGGDLTKRIELFSKARAAAKRALEIDETLAEAHTSLGLISMNFDWDWAAAEREYRRAIELDPNYALAHHWYAEYLAPMGRFDEALAEVDHAQMLDPLSITISTDRGKILYFARRYDESIEQLRKTLELDPTFLQARLWLAMAYAAKGLYVEAAAQLERATAESDDLLWGKPHLALTYGLAGRRGEALKILDELRQANRRKRLDPLTFTAVHIGLGEKEAAFAWLEREYEVRSVGLTSLKVNPIYDGLRADPRFASLMRRVGLAL
jgi:DNA-binding winged helix-turn-helix (wHTH) protein/TolB-like protein/Tfp pilus assembly protein PilF